MPHCITPNSFGTFVEPHPWPLMERNPCHNPKDGKFAPKGQGNCAPIGVKQNVLAGTGTERLHLPRATREKIIALTNVPEGKTFPLDKALKLAGPTFTKQYLSLMEKAPTAHAEMSRGLEKVAERLGGKMVPYAEITEPGGVFASMGNIKGAHRLVEKIVEKKFGDLTEAKDVVRSTIAVDHPGQLAAVIKAVRQRFKVVDEDDRFAKPLGEYRDHQILVRLSNGLIGEIQIHAKPILKAKEGPGHKLFEIERSPHSSPAAKEKANREASILYGRANREFEAARPQHVIRTRRRR